MGKPVAHTLNENKRKIIHLFPDVLKKTSLQLVGHHNRLGLISFRQHSGPILYAHIVENKDGKTRISIAGVALFKRQKTDGCTRISNKTDHRKA